MKTYTLKVNGMTCHACENLITMDLEDAGLPMPKEIHADSGTLVIEARDDQFDHIKQVIAASNKYTVESITETTI